MDPSLRDFTPNNHSNQSIDQKSLNYGQTTPITPQNLMINQSKPLQVVIKNTSSTHS